MSRDNQNELIVDVYRAKLVYQAEMKSPEYRAKGEEDFEFIGKELYRKGYRKIHDDHQKQAFCYTFGCQEADKIGREVARKIFEEIARIGGTSYGDIRLNSWDFAELKKRYTEGCDGLI